MAVYISAETDFYSAAWLRSTARRYGVGVTDDPVAATAFWVNVSDVEDLSNLRQTRKIANGRPVVAGGLECASGNGAALAWADACVVGEGEEFIEAWGAGGIEAALSLPCVQLRSAPLAPVTPSTRIDFKCAPLMQATAHCWYVLAARGCPQHCGFCYTSWSTKHQAAPRNVLQAYRTMLDQRDARSQLTYITNYSQGLPGKKRGAQSFLLRDFLRNPAEAKGLTLIRLGIEAPVKPAGSGGASPSVTLTCWQVSTWRVSDTTNLNYFSSSASRMTTRIGGTSPITVCHWRGAMVATCGPSSHTSILVR